MSMIIDSYSLLLSDTEFGAENPVTFNQAVKMLVSMLGYQAKAEEGGGYPDGYIAVAGGLGILEGADIADRELTRAEAAGLIYSSLNTGVLKTEGDTETTGDDLLTALGYTSVMGEVFKVESKTINLWDEFIPLYDEEAGGAPVIKAYMVEGENRPGVVFYPGGAYHHLSVKESQQIPKFLNSLGISVFLVEYRCAPYTCEAILSDAFRAIRLVRANAQLFNINPEKVGVMGCSAGGHLAATVSTLYYDAAGYIDDTVDKTNPKPDFTILCYPVISFKDDLTHKGSRDYFTNYAVTRDVIDNFSCENNVDEKTPPTFLWHTAADGSVKVENSLEYARALAENDVPFELHIYPFGGHGLAVAAEVERTGEWTRDCAKWLKLMDIID